MKTQICITAIKNFLRGENLAVEYWTTCDDYHPEDEVFSRGESEPKFSEISPRNLLKEVREQDGIDYLHGLKTSSEVLRGIRTLLSEAEVGWVSTLAEAKAAFEERKRQRLERTAARFATKCGFGVGTPGFARALNSAIEGLDERVEESRGWEQRMERFAACRYAGGDFWADEDFISARFDAEWRELEEVREWLHANCPLLMAQCAEEELRGELD